jgi:type IV secretion system protein VirB3
MENADKAREIAIHQSANRPNLLLGADRELVLVTVMVSGGLAFSLACWWGVGVAVALWLGSIAPCSGWPRPTPSSGTLTCGTSAT